MHPFDLVLSAERKLANQRAERRESQGNEYSQWRKTTAKISINGPPTDKRRFLGARLSEYDEQKCWL